MLPRVTDELSRVDGVVAATEVVSEALVMSKGGFAMEGDSSAATVTAGCLVVAMLEIPKLMCLSVSMVKAWSKPIVSAFTVSELPEMHQVRLQMVIKMGLGADKSNFRHTQNLDMGFAAVQRLQQLYRVVLYLDFTVKDEVRSVVESAGCLEMWW